MVIDILISSVNILISMNFNFYDFALRDNFYELYLTLNK